MLEAFINLLYQDQLQCISAPWEAVLEQLLPPVCGAGASEQGQHIAAIAVRAKGASQLLAAGLGHAHLLDVHPVPSPKLPRYADVEANGFLALKALAHQHTCSTPCFLMECCPCPAHTVMAQIRGLPGPCPQT